MMAAMKPSAWIVVVVALAGCKQSDSTPSACEGVDFIFDSEPCLAALTTQCRTYTTEAECWDAEPMKVAVVGDYVYCAWTQVAVVGDEQTCEIASSFGRCEAALPASPDGPSEACVDGQFFMEENAYTAFVDDRELVDSGFSAPDGTVYEALLYWTGTSATPCNENVVAPVSTPPIPEWCSCASAACLITGD
jgi:hypothetical protein